MAIAPTGGNTRFIVGHREKSPSAAQSGDDADEVARGQGVIDNASEYASMGMLAANHVRRRASSTSPQDEWNRFAERILDNQADQKILRIEEVLNREMMTPRQLRAFLMQFFTDASDLLLVMSAIIHRGQLKKKQVERLKELQKQLEAEDLDRSAQAGINVALVAKAFAQRMRQSAGDLRVLYRLFLSYDGAVIYLYGQWMEKMAAQERGNLISYLARALASDLQALPLGNINASEFGQYFLRIGRLREIKSLEEGFLGRFTLSWLPPIDGDLEKDLREMFISGVRGELNVKETVLGFFTGKLSVLSADLQARFLQSMIIGFSALPVGVFFLPEERERLIDELKEMMNYFMEKEREMARWASLKGEQDSHE
ncbi:type III secretion system gatekeeper subunit SctW [Enterobacter mori]|uniref:type III secretion system gatekeeper subunit SctW n=1 Tax=Enterobacter mori TaxID=539813 RepID=UPI001B8B6F7F|nr:type III secretion system gatekeeper subunit SctW [Enterobacter mori]MBS3050414.1 YopN family type III secretion system gatekeeper subunit [Enterobacter mori]